MKGPRYMEGDRLEDGSGNTAVVVQCKGKKGPYLKAKISGGPRTGEWCWPERFAEPSLDWEKDGPVKQCADCERWFRPGYEDSMPRIFCRQCDGRFAKTEHRMAADASPSHGFGGNRPRVFRRAGETGTDPF